MEKTKNITPQKTIRARIAAKNILKKVLTYAGFYPSKIKIFGHPGGYSFMNKAFLLTGGNLGDRYKNMERCSFLVEKTCGHIIRRSSIYETAAWGKTDQPDYLNQILLIDTAFTPEHLLSVLLSVEKDMGRFRGEKYGPRIIDIDILLYNDEVINESLLKIPHPRMQDRRFVLEPMNEIASEMIHPVFQKTMHQLLLECTDPLAVNKKSAWV